MLSPQYFYAFCHRTHAGLLFYFFCCTSYGMVTCTAFSITHIFFSVFQREYFLHLCSFSPHLKHSTSITFYLFIVLSFTPHCITLLNNTSNLFWEIVVPFSPSLLFLQLQARYPNFLQLKHNFPFLLSSSSLSLVRVCFSLSILLMMELYCCRDMVLYLYKIVQS